MGASLKQGGRGRQRYTPMAEINMTPFIDVMLVLLIVFMVAAPLLTVGVPVDLPKTQAASINQQVEPLTVSIDQQGRIFLQETELRMDQVVPRLRAVLAEKPDQTVFVRGDRVIAYGRIMEVMGLLAASGIQKVSLIAELPEGRPASPAPAPAQRTR
ncbi:MAG: protein TolR [Alphaproteobacteria bacterium]|nr:protein TolR [Alphaproteobacteria bacterium]TAD91429.1 MAG: protein TolR [Alphaproteobacteria bacterium]